MEKNMKLLEVYRKFVKELKVEFIKGINDDDEYYESFTFQFDDDNDLMSIYEEIEELEEELEETDEEEIEEELE